MSPEPWEDVPEPLSQQEILDAARKLCVCSGDDCSEHCTACDALDPEWPCPKDMGPEGEQ